MRPRQRNSRAVLWRTRKSHRQESLQPPHSNGWLQRQNWSEKHKWQNEMHRTLWNRQQKWERGKTAGFCWRKQPSSNKLTLLQSSKQILDMGSSRRCDQKPNWLHTVFKPEDSAKLWGNNQSRYWQWPPYGQSKSRNRQKTNETKKNSKTKTLPIRPQSIRKISHSLQNWTKKQIWHSERRRTIYRENEHSPERSYGHHTKPNTKVHNREEYWRYRNWKLRQEKKRIKTKNKQNTKRQGRISRTQQISEKETQNKSTEEKKRINTGNTGSKKRSKTDQ